MSWLSSTVRGVQRAVKSVRKKVGLPAITVGNAVKAATNVIPGGGVVRSAVGRALDVIRGKGGNVGQAIEDSIAVQGEQLASKVGQARTDLIVGSVVTSPLVLLAGGAALMFLLGSRRR